MDYSEQPAWRLKSIDFDGPWCPKSMSPDDLLRVLTRIGNLETMTWQEILVGARKENHAIKISDLSKEAQARLATLKLDDVDDVISLRVTGRERIFGIRFGSVVRLLWWDPEHQVCPSTKKHT